MYEGPDTLDYWLEPDLLAALRHDMEKYVEKIAKLEHVAEELKALRRALEIRAISGGKQFSAYAVDSSYGSPPLELVGGVFTVVAYGYVGVVDGAQDRFLSGTLYFSDSREGDISRFASLLERRLAARLLETRARGKKNFDVLLLDGDIAIHPLPYNLAVRGGKYEEVNRVVDRMLAAAEAGRATVVGVAKRVRSRYLSVAAGRCLPVNDKVAASVVLSPGEYFSLGKLRDLLPKWAPIHYAECEGGAARDEVLRCYRGEAPARGEKAERLCRRLREFYENFNRVLTNSAYPHLRLLGDVEVVYYRPPGSRTAVRAEVLDLGNLGLENVVGYLASTASTVTGYPQLLDSVDQYVRVSPELVEAVLTSLMLKAPGELAFTLWPTNPQKRLAGRF